jgi:hypothetical protein
VPPSGAQGPGFDRYKVSPYECTSTNDGARSFPMPDKCATNVAKEEALAAAEAAYMPTGHGDGAVQSVAYQYQQQAVLIDCGNGVSALEPSKGEVGRTLQNLAAAGVDPRASAWC